MNLTLNKRSLVPEKMLYILKSVWVWKYWSNELRALMMPAVLTLFRRTTISPSTIVVSAHSVSILNPVLMASDPLRQIIRKSFGFRLRLAACSIINV